MNKLVVVTGGSRGIGLAIVEKFSELGYAIALCSRNKENLDRVKNNFEGKRIFTFAADLSKKSEVEKFGNFVLNLNIPIVCLINNAGVFIQGKIFEEPEENLTTQLETNLLSAYYLTRMLIGNLKDQKSSHIFNISSIAGVQAYPQSGSYSISKFALQGFSKSIREELKNTSVKVSTIIPGATYTDSWKGAGLPETRFIQAKDIAEIISTTFNLSKSTVVEEIVLRPQLGDI